MRLVYKILFLIILNLIGHFAIGQSDTTFQSIVLCRGDEFQGQEIVEDTLIFENNGNEFIGYLIDVSFINDFEIMGPESICKGDTVVLEIPDFDSILWNTGSLSNKIQILNEGTYQVTVGNVRGCFATATHIVDKINWDHTFTPSDPICSIDDGSIAVTITDSNVSTTTQLFFEQDLIDESTSQLDTFNNLLHGKYVIKINGAEGCYTTDSIELNSAELNQFNFDIEDTIVNIYSNLLLPINLDFEYQGIIC